MIRVIFSLNTLRHVTNVDCIFSSPNWTCFRYKEIITILIVMVCAICEAEIVISPILFIFLNRQGLKFFHSLISTYP